MALTPKNQSLSQKQSHSKLLIEIIILGFEFMSKAKRKYLDDH